MTLDILMPFYGRFDHLRYAVESVLSQTDPHWRLTVVDDVYPDAAPGKWVRELDERRVRYHRNTENLGPSRNYDAAVEMAESEHVVLMGCDDMMLPGYVDRVRSILSAWPQADIVQPGVQVIDENGDASRPLADKVKAFYRGPLRRTRVAGGEPLATSLLRGNWTYFPSLVWRRSRLTPSGFRADLNVVQDLAKLVEIIFDGGTLVADPEIVFSYRRHSTSVSARTGVDGSKFAQERILFREAEEAADARGWTTAARAARHHLSSRLNAATELPTAILNRNGDSIRALSRHIFGGVGEP